MKRSLLLIVVVVALVGCPMQMSDWEGSALPPGATGAMLPVDQVRDVARSVTGPFTFETLYPVSLNIEVNLYDTDSRGYIVGEPLPPESATVIVKLEDLDGDHIFSGQVSEDGLFQGTVQVPSAAEDARLTITAENFEERTILLNDLADFSEIDRTVSLQRIVFVDGRFISRSVADAVDTDGDGVPDDRDAYPDNPDAAFRLNVPADGRITIAFEDLYGRANAGDADYNDFIAAYAITEVLNADGGVVWIEVDADAITKLAGYDHTFGIRIDSFFGRATLLRTFTNAWGRTETEKTMVIAPTEIVLFENSRHDIGRTASFQLLFSVPQTHNPRDPEVGLSDAPYNPYVVVHNTGHDVHLVDREPLTDSINPGDRFMDGDGFPWALLVPINWDHPDEGQRIEVHYPQFENWRLSGGTTHTDWYNHYDDPWVEPPAGGSDVYVAGYYHNGSTDVAAYWTKPVAGGDIVRTDLTDQVPPGSNAYANDVFFDGTSVYVAGYYELSGIQVAVYWVDGVASPALTSPGQSGEATGIFVDGVDVYVSGKISTGTASMPVYWANGAPVELQGATSNATAAEIYASGGDVLIAGFFQAAPAQPFAATLWADPSLNGLPEIDLAAGTISEAFDVDVSPSGQIYVAGSYYNMAGVGNFASVYWTVDPGDSSFIRTVLYDVPGNWSKAFGVDEEAGVLYAAGYYVNAYDVPGYWEAGSLQPLQGTEGQARDVDVSAAGVSYVVGYLVEGGSRYAALWVDGVVSELPRIGVLRAEARSVFVAE